MKGIHKNTGQLILNDMYGVAVHLMKSKVRAKYITSDGQRYTHTVSGAARRR